MQVSQSVSRAYQLNKIFWMAADWIFPPHCGGCQQPGTRWCDVCNQSVDVVDWSTHCKICAAPVLHPGVCTTCHSNPMPMSAILSWGVYQGPLREGIHSMKYQNNLGIAQDLSLPLISIINNENWQIDCITAVPLSSQRQKQRGYNQSIVLARWIAWGLGLPFMPDLLSRTRDTRSQIGLSAIERHRNVEDAFSTSGYNVNHKVVLIIDDVTTTGATLINCGKALANAGAKEVFGLTLAKAVHLDMI